MIDSSFNVLNENDDWMPYQHHFSNLDVYYSKEYVSLFAQKENGVPEAIYYEQAGHRLFYPYIKREITDGLYDIVTPYGYGGPIWSTDVHHEVVSHFEKSFSHYCQLNNIITETIRFHPLLQNERKLHHHMKVEYIRKTTAVDLTQSLDHIRSQYSSTNKRNIKKASRSDLEIAHLKSESDMDTFISLYEETMNRNSALNYYYFDGNHFNQLMKPTKWCTPYLLGAKHKGEVIAAVILLIGPQNAHYHLGASRTDFLSLRPNNLLFDCMIQFAKENGAKNLHLGGGYQENDGLFAFKSAFTGNNHFSYYIGKKIHNEVVYQMLTEKKGNAASQRPHFFPAYRA
ncbi:GNAT family N-acetyltransferase [Bacillus sp. E(2018)]|uniref:lipid II:glycine glycyltransferase FemX n=1 Tax=Bacillus sp. E(2018) TaxID=2502239 RepID=UPI0010F99D5F|nr:GNAT family N-acetyltransferase [Bacillus sp. E(2018)]